MLRLAGYWPSYNIPFHVEIYNLSGYSVMWKRYGEDFSYDLCPRAKILRRDQGKVSDLSSLKHMMRYNSRYNNNSGSRHTFFWSQLASDMWQKTQTNHSRLFQTISSMTKSQTGSISDYKRDPYSKGHPCKTICCRNDLRPRRPRPGGCYDTKVRGNHRKNFLFLCRINITFKYTHVDFKLNSLT